LGGVGSRIVDLIASRASHLPNWTSQLSTLTSFISIDTNELDQKQLKKIPEGNRIKIGAFDKQSVIAGYRASQDVQALQWLDRGYVARDGIRPSAGQVPGYEPREGIKPGAGQIRIESRLGFFHESPTIRHDLSRIVQAMLVPANTWRRDRHFYVYIYATLAGGTGSGSFLSAAYLITDVIRSIGEWQPRVIGNLLLSTLMTPVVDPKLHPNIHANTYAALKELEHLTKLNYKQVKDEGRKSEKFAYWHDANRVDVMEVRSGPFFLSFVYDQPSSFTLEDVERTVADTAYLQVFTPNIDNMASALDNYEQHLQRLAQLPGDLRNVGQGYTTYFGAVGASALVLPAKDLLKYCALRFAAEALRTQITFGKASEDPTDDRARSLAQLAVDYSDPRFLRMSDEGRNEAINQSFVNSVKEMKRQDEREDLKDGFWYQIVESIDEGHPTTNEKGEVQRGESRLKEIKRKLGEARQALLDKVSIRERSFTFHREGVNSYIENVSLLEEDIRRARVVVQEGMEGVKRSAREGEVVTDLKLDPIAERYLVLRLLSECQEKWIPEAQAQYDAAKARDITTPSVRERLREELFKSLQQASKRSIGDRIRRNDEAFLRVRDEAQEYFRSVTSAARKVFDAEIGLGQLRELLTYLQARTRQYAALARHMNTLVADLERQAEDLRHGHSGEPRLALSVEVFETLEEPKERIWDRVYRDLYVDEGRYLSTFDRSTLARCIAEQLMPQIRADGLVEAKPTEKIVSDLREALVELGEERLKGAIFGEGSDHGLDLWRGLDLEARLMLNRAKSDGRKPSDQEVETYRGRKFKSLAQVSGVLARVDADTFQARKDGVIVGKGRSLVHGLGPAANTSTFLKQLTSVLAEGGHQVNYGHWHDPRIAIVYDVIAPIALYYVRPILGELQKNYQMLQADERRSFHLHTDYHWEESLPNLNPMESELEVGWAMNTVARGLIAGVIEQLPGGNWVWHRKQIGAGQSSDQDKSLGQTLSGALYRFGEYYRSEDLRKTLDAQIRQELERIGADGKADRQQRWREVIQNAITEIELRQQDGDITQDDVLDRPILRVLNKLLEAEIATSKPMAAAYRLPTQ
jgi:hypothetical protein